MARQQLYPEKYICTKCKIEQQHYTWSDEIETKTHTCKTADCNTTLTVENLSPETPAAEVFAIKMTSGQVKRERQARSTQHFRNHIQGTFEKGSDEQRHFDQKYKPK